LAGLRESVSCIETTWTIHAEGYGVRYVGRRSILAHREAWENEHGPIPAGLCVLHRCDNRRCVNVEHLFLGTRADNAADRHAKGRDARGEHNGRARLTVDTIRAIRAELAVGVRQAEIAQEYGISQQHVSDIKLKRRWAHA